MFNTQSTFVVRFMFLFRFYVCFLHLQVKYLLKKNILGKL